MKKFVTLFLLLALALVLCAVPAFAEGGMAHPDQTNIAFEAVVETWDEGGANSSIENPEWFSAVNLTDGRLEEFDGDGTNLAQSLAWYTASLNRDTQIAARVELDTTFKIGEIYLYPTKFLSGTNTPTTFTVSISVDGEDWEELDSENWTTVGGETNLKDFVNYTEPFVYNANGAEAGYIRIYITRNSAISDSQYYGGFGEIEVYEYVEPQLNIRDFNADTDKQYFDQILVNGEEKANGNEAVAALKAGIDGSDGSINDITMFGWFGLTDESISFADTYVSFGYIIDDGKPVFDSSFTADTEQEVSDLNGLRYKIKVDVTGLQDGADHVIKGCVRLANDEVVIFNRPEREAIINYKAPLTATPEPTAEPTAEPTDAPAETEAPAVATEAPEVLYKKGCGGVIGGGIALIAVAAAAVFAARKKD